MVCFSFNLFLGSAFASRSQHAALSPPRPGRLRDGSVGLCAARLSGGSRGWHAVVPVCLCSALTGGLCPGDLGVATCIPGVAALLSASPYFGLMVVLGFPFQGARWAAQPSP